MAWRYVTGKCPKIGRDGLQVPVYGFQNPAQFPHINLSGRRGPARSSKGQAGAKDLPA